ncbi:MAG: helix-turn-helix transcriptional regulator [Victivallales bacterium]|jgi:AraC-like DNA-binding protein|nr:helix-turn-helix transcriptional regulator [Victivallales bacterium]
MDNLCVFLDELLAWVTPLPQVPVTYAAEDRIPVNTARAPYLELGFHAEGSPANVSVADLSIRTEPGTVVALNAHFGNRGIAEGQWAYWCLSFAAPLSGSLVRFAAQPLLLAGAIPNPGRVRDHYAAVVRQFSRRQGCHEPRLKARVLLLLACLREELDPRNPGRAHGPRAVEAAVDVLHQRFADPELRLSDVAATVGLSRAHLCRLFQRERRESPMRLLARLRLERAAELLTRTHLDIGEIAFAVGYGDRLYFSRVFHRFAGCSPTEYRRRYPAG